MRAQKEIEMRPLAAFGTPRAQVCLGITKTFLHVICDTQENANIWAKKVYAEGVALAVPTVYPKDEHHPDYPANSYYFRIHESAQEKFKTQYGIEQISLYNKDGKSTALQAGSIFQNDKSARSPNDGNKPDHGCILC